VWLITLQLQIRIEKSNVVCHSSKGVITAILFASIHPNLHSHPCKHTSPTLAQLRNL
jgi:hypothetical protein